MQLLHNTGDFQQQKVIYNPRIYIGTGGYSDTDLVGTLYPFGTDKSDFLTIYSQHYDAIEINNTFHAPIGAKALQGRVEKKI